MAQNNKTIWGCFPKGLFPPAKTLKLPNLSKSVPLRLKFELTSDLPASKAYPMINMRISLTMTLFVQLVGLSLLVSTLALPHRRTLVYISAGWRSAAELECVKAGLITTAERKGKDWGFPSETIRVIESKDSSVSIDGDDNTLSHVYTKPPRKFDTHHAHSIGVVSIDASSGEKPVFNMKNDSGNDELKIGTKDSDMEFQKDEKGKWRVVEKGRTQQKDSEKSMTNTSQSESDGHE
ncbi:hypothetical protein F5880DRAFT_1664624 [Lentinula raphanica]|nr:hypothetical protein F5880DRAFT_1664624 [Lentinula raphanica]